MTEGQTTAQQTQDGTEALFPFHRRNTIVLALANLGYVTGFMLFYPYLPLIVRELGAVNNLESWVGAIVGGIFGLTFLFTPIWGGMADHYGRKSMVLRAGLGIGVIFLGLAYSPSLGWFLVLALFLGLTNGFVAAVQALVATNTPPAVMGRSISIVQTAANMGGSLGPAIGALLATLLGAYQNLYFVCAGLALTGGVMVLLFVREVHTRPAQPFRLHLLRDLLDCLRIPGMPVLFLLNFVLSSVFFGNVSVISMYVMELMPRGEAFAGLSVAAWVGLASLSITVTSGVGVLVWGWLLDRIHPSPLLIFGLLGAIVCALPMPLLQDPLQLAIARGVLGLVGAGIQPALIIMIKARSPKGMEARALSFGTSLYMLGHGGAPVLAGIIGPLLGLRAYFWSNVLMLLAGLGLWLLSVRRGANNPVV